MGAAFERKQPEFRPILSKLSLGSRCRPSCKLTVNVAAQSLEKAQRVKTDRFLLREACLTPGFFHPRLLQSGREYFKDILPRHPGGKVERVVIPIMPPALPGLVLQSQGAHVNGRLTLIMFIVICTFSKLFYITFILVLILIYRKT